MVFKNVTVSLPSYRSTNNVLEKVCWKVRDIFHPHNKWHDAGSCIYEESFAKDVVRIYEEEKKCVITFHPFTIFVQVEAFLETEPMKDHILQIGIQKGDLKNHIKKLILHDFFISINNPPQKPFRRTPLKPWGTNCNKYKDNRIRRIDLIVMSLSVLKKKNEGQNYLKYAVLQNFFFETVAEPIVAVEELRGFFHSICKESEYCTVTEYYCDLFKKVFPQYPEQLHPRSLKHLCRCLFRKHLSSYGKKKQEVWSLDIPETLKTYLLLDEEYHELCISIEEPCFWVKYE